MNEGVSIKPLEPKTDRYISTEMFVQGTTLRMAVYNWNIKRGQKADKNSAEYKAKNYEINYDFPVPYNAKRYAESEEACEKIIKIEYENYVKNFLI